MIFSSENEPDTNSLLFLFIYFFYMGKMFDYENRYKCCNLRKTLKEDLVVTLAVVYVVIGHMSF